MRVLAESRNRVRGSVALYAVLMTGVVSGAFGEDADSDTRSEGVALVERFIANVETMSGRFEQSLVDADDQVVETSGGTFEIRRPGRFRWSYETPYEQLLVADGTNVWSYDVDLAQVSVKPQADVLTSTPALLLGGGGNVLDEFEIVDSFEDRGTEWVRLVPRNQDGGFTMVELGFTDDMPSRMIFSDNLAQTTLVIMYEVVLNGPIADSQFQFSPPADVDVVGKPIKPVVTD
jgi:outer membrane lipoprotein carrier protein